MKGIVLTTAAIILTGCATPLPEHYYKTEAQIAALSKLCTITGFISHSEHSDGMRSITYLLGQWDFDNERFNDEVLKAMGKNFHFKASKSSCSPTKQAINQRILLSRQHMQKAIAAQLYATYTSNSLIKMAAQQNQQLMQTNQALLNQNSTYNQPLFTPKPTLPTPQGYEKTRSNYYSSSSYVDREQSMGMWLCKYDDGRAIRINLNESCPRTLQPKY